MGSWRQGQRLGQSRSADGGTNQGVGESAGDRPRGRQPGRRARFGARAGCTHRAAGARGWAGTACFQAGWTGLGAVGPDSGSSRPGCGRTAGRSSRVGCSGSSTFDPRLFPVRIGAAPGVDFPLRAAVVLDGATAVFGLATPAGAPDERFFREPAGRWPAVGAHAASRHWPPSRAQRRSALLLDAFDDDRGSAGLPTSEAGRLHVVGGNSLHDSAGRRAPLVGWAAPSRSRHRHRRRTA